MKNTLLLIIAGLFIYTISIEGQSARFQFRNGQAWYDTDNKPIEAHSGGVLEFNGKYYWYGENHALGSGNKTGISCYSSLDLYIWKNEGVVLPKTSVPDVFQDKGVCERPKVLYNATTHKFVMWMHLDGDEYTLASAGVAIADKPTGPFVFQNYFRPIKFDYGNSKTDTRTLKTAEMERGNTYRDMNLFLDDDGIAYVLYAAEDNATLYIARLNTSFTDVEKPTIEGQTWVRALPFAYREAPAPFEYKGKYYIITSGLTGWSPNPAKYHVADNMMGPWKTYENPCIGANADVTFFSQSTFVLKAPIKKEGCFIFMADRWNGNELEKSTFVWLPFCMKSDGSFQLTFLEQWDLSVFGDARIVGVPEVKNQSSFQNPDKNVLSWNPIEGAHAYNIFQNGKQVDITTNFNWQAPVQLCNRSYSYSVAAWNLSAGNSALSEPLVLQWKTPVETFLNEITPDAWLQGFGNLAINRSLSDGPLKIVDKVFATGLGTHANSEIVYNIAGAYNRFQSWVGCDAYPSFLDTSSMVFIVYGDGKLLYKSDVMRVNTPAARVDISIKGVFELKLVVDATEDGNNYDHANWAEPKVLP